MGVTIMITLQNQNGHSAASASTGTFSSTGKRKPITSWSSPLALPIPRLLIMRAGTRYSRAGWAACVVRLATKHESRPAPYANTAALKYGESVSVAPSFARTRTWSIAWAMVTKRPGMQMSPRPRMAYGYLMVEAATSTASRGKRSFAGESIWVATETITSEPNTQKMS